MGVLRRIRDRLYERGIRGHWVNDNDKPGGGTGHIAKHGRFYLHLGRQVVHLSWNHWSTFAHVSVRVGDEDDLTVSLALPPVAYWLSIGRLPRWLMHRLPWEWRRPGVRYPNPREIGVSVHHGSVWWNVWSDAHEWRHDDPKWMAGSWNPLDSVLGRQIHTERTIEERDVVIPMPEGGYPAKVKMAVARWERPRWPSWPMRTEIVRARVDIPGGIGMPGKGENSWDCGDDATYSLSCEARSVEDAIGRVVSSVLHDRRRRGGSHEFKKSEAP